MKRSIILAILLAIVVADYFVGPGLRPTKPTKPRPPKPTKGTIGPPTRGSVTRAPTRASESMNMTSGGGSCAYPDFRQIQQAIDHIKKQTGSKANDRTIIVCPGNYKGFKVFDMHKLNIETSENPEDIFGDTDDFVDITPSNRPTITSTTFIIDSDETNIKGLKFWKSILFMKNADRVRIKNNFFYGCKTRKTKKMMSMIHVMHSNDVKIQDNGMKIHGKKNAILFEKVVDFDIRGNTIFGAPIVVKESTDGEVEENHVMGKVSDCITIWNSKKLDVSENNLKGCNTAIEIYGGDEMEIDRNKICSAAKGIVYDSRYKIRPTPRPRPTPNPEPTPRPEPTKEPIPTEDIDDEDEDLEVEGKKGNKGRSGNKIKIEENTIRKIRFVAIYTNGADDESKIKNNIISYVRGVAILSENAKKSLYVAYNKINNVNEGVVFNRVKNSNMKANEVTRSRVGLQFKNDAKDNVVEKNKISMTKACFIDCCQNDFKRNECNNGP